MSAALTFDHVSGGYRRHSVFTDLSFQIPEGSLCAVLGPNGSGKTTLLRAATGLLDRLHGEVRLFGENVSALPADRRAQLVGVVPQEMSTPMAFTVDEIVTMGRTRALRRWGRPSLEDLRIIEQAMVYTDIDAMRRRPFTELSGGEKQRAVIAMVLAQQPRLILLDEATSHLDINHRLEIMDIVERLNREQGVTIVMVSHDPNLAAEFCERLLLLDQGRLVADGKPAEVLTEEILHEVYRCKVRIRRDPETGTVSVAAAPRKHFCRT